MATTIGPTSGLAGYEAGEVYAPGAAFSLRYESKGAALPLTLSLLDWNPDSISTTTTR